MQVTKDSFQLVHGPAKVGKFLNFSFSQKLKIDQENWQGLKDWAMQYLNSNVRINRKWADEMAIIYAVISTS